MFPVSRVFPVRAPPGSLLERAIIGMEQGRARGREGLRGGGKGGLRGLGRGGVCQEGGGRPARVESPGAEDPRTRPTSSCHT